MLGVSAVIFGLLIGVSLSLYFGLATSANQNTEFSFQNQTTSLQTDGSLTNSTSKLYEKRLNYFFKIFQKSSVREEMV